MRLVPFQEKKVVKIPNDKDNESLNAKFFNLADELLNAREKLNDLEVKYLVEFGETPLYQKFRVFNIELFETIQEWGNFSDEQLQSKFIVLRNTREELAKEIRIEVGKLDRSI